MKKFMLFLAAFLMLISPLAAAQAMSVTWEWLLDDPEVNYYRYQLDGQDEDGWTEVDGTVSSYTVDGLDPYSTYTLYLQRSYDGIYWSASAEAVAEPLLVEEIPESTDITPVLEPAVEELPVVEAGAEVAEELAAEEESVPEELVVEEPAEEELVPVELLVEEPVVEEEAEEAEPVVEEEVVEEVVELAAPIVSIVPDVAPSYVAEEPVEEPVVAIGEEEEFDEDYLVLGEEAEVVVEENDIVLVDEDEDDEEFETEQVPVEEPVVSESIQEVVEEETPEEEIAAEEAPMEIPAEEPAPVEPVEEVAAKNDFRFSLLLKGGANLPLDFKNKIQIMPAGLNGTFGFDFANIFGIGKSCGIGLRADVGLSLIPNQNGWGTQIKSFKKLIDLRTYAQVLDVSLFGTFDAMAGIVDFTFGAGFSGGIMFPNSIRSDQFAYNRSFTAGGKTYTYKLAPAALLGMRFYCGDLFSIGVEGTYRAAIGDWMHHDVTANLVMGFSF